MKEELQKLPVDVLKIIRRYRDSYKHYKKFKLTKRIIKNLDYYIYSYAYHDRGFKVNGGSVITRFPHCKEFSFDPCQSCGYEMKYGEKVYICRCKDLKVKRYLYKSYCF